MANEMMDVSLPGRLPVSHKAEVLVVGGGPGGIGAAVAAARAGRDVLLAEQYGSLGGMATAGEVQPFMQNHIGGRSLDEGIYTEWAERMAYYGGLHENRRIFDPHAAKLAAEDLCLAAGVRLLYHHRAIHVEVESGLIRGVVLHSKGGLSACKAAVYVDSTGDGDVAALAGCPFEYGAGPEALAQPMTLCFKLKVVAPGFTRDTTGPDGTANRLLGDNCALIQEAYRRAKAERRIECPRENVLMFRCVEPDVIHFNTTRVVRKSGIDGGELSAAEIEGRRQLRQFFDLLRREVPLFEGARIQSIASQIGVRESRRILGRHYLTRRDFENASHFADGITRANYPMDIHSSTGEGGELIGMAKGKWYEIPYGCLVPRGVENLLIASRCISADHAIHGSLRVMPIVCSLGQAAGMAAAMALETGISAPQVEGRELRKRLISTGRNLE